MGSSSSWSLSWSSSSGSSSPSSSSSSLSSSSSSSSSSSAATAAVSCVFETNPRGGIRSCDAFRPPQTTMWKWPPLKLKLRKLQLGDSSLHEAFVMLAHVHQTFRHLAFQLEHCTISARQLRNCSERHQRTSFLPHFH